jgi:hypothetical protein
MRTGKDNSRGDLCEKLKPDGQYLENQMYSVSVKTHVIATFTAVWPEDGNGVSSIFPNIGRTGIIFLQDGRLLLFQKPLFPVIVKRNFCPGLVLVLGRRDCPKLNV